MKAELYGKYLTLPAPSPRTDGRPYPLSKSAGTRTGYDATGIVDVVDLRRTPVRTLPANPSAANPSAPTSVKGIYIDLWA